MPTLSNHRQNIEDLISHNRIEEARDYCRIMTHPDARLWLSEIDQRFPIESNPVATSDGKMMTDGEIGPRFLSEPHLNDDIEGTEKAKRGIQINYTTRRFLTWLFVSGIIMVGLWTFGIRLAAFAIVLLVWFVPAALGLQSFLHPKSGRKRMHQPSEYPFETTPIPLPPLHFTDEAALNGDESRGYFVPQNPYKHIVISSNWHEPNSTDSTSH